ncbi:MAG: DUF1326 domain-containing protein [Verrucomicrobia bacterium]|nr:DUF1326 domain-containing protein [Verrucomicrobiota bacterium]
MSEPAKIKWRMAGEEVANCNCNWGCPCQFNAPPTTGQCEALVALQISDGFFGDTRLDGVRFARLYWWPGSIPEGNGVRRTIVNEQASQEQRDALIALDSAQHGGLYWEIFAAVCPNLIEALFAPITFNVDREKRRATIRIPGIAESDTEPIKNSSTGEEHKARIALPNGFEFKEAEMGNTVSGRVSAGDKLTFELKNSYAQLNAFDWNN